MPWHFLLNKSVHGDTKVIQAYFNHKIALSFSTNTSVTNNGSEIFLWKGCWHCCIPWGQVSCLSIKSFLSETDSGCRVRDLCGSGDSVNVVHISCFHCFHYDSYRKDGSGKRLYEGVRYPLTFHASSFLYHLFWTIRNHKISCLSG